MKKVLIIFVVLITGLLTAGVKQVDGGVEFFYTAPNAGSVSVAGDFNGWDTNADPLQKGDGGVWKTVINLPAGSHAYKYVVDGSWLYDDQNPNTIDDGYGGSNSLVEVTDSGKITATETVKREMPSSVNPKVYFDGRYYVNNKMHKDDMSRFYLDKPYHDLNLGIKVKLNANMEGYTVLNVNNTREGVDMWKTHLNYRRTYMKLQADYLEIYAFDNFGTIRFDDPLHIVGSMGYYDYDFGYGFRGVQLSTDSDLLLNNTRLPLGFYLNVFGADQVGDDERDVVAGRLKTVYDFNYLGYEHSFCLGGSFYNSRTNNNYSHTFNDTLSYSGGIVDSNPAWEIDAGFASSLTQPHWQGSLDYALLYEHYRFENKKEYKDHNQFDFFAADEHVWQDGSRDYLRLNLKFPKALSLQAGLTKNKVNLYYEDFSNNPQELPSPDINEAELSRTRFEFGADFELDNFSASLDMKRWTTDYADSVASWNDYYRFIERTDGTGKWYQEHSELSFAQYMLLGYDTGLLCNLKLKYDWQKLHTEFKASIARYDFTYKPELVVNTLRLSYDLSSKWQIITDTRIPVYNSEFLGIKTDFSADEDVYIANYTALKYHLNEYVWIALSYGVNPQVINDTTDEFYNGGRREFLEDNGGLDDYLFNTYSGFGDKVKTAEDALMKDDRISLEAVVRF